MGAACREKTEVLSSDDDTLDIPVILEALSPPPSTPAYTPTYKKSLRLSSDQIVSVPAFQGHAKAQVTKGQHPCSGHTP